MATQSVKDILNAKIPNPAFVLRPSAAVPLPSGVNVKRRGGDNVARTLNPFSGTFKQVDQDTPRIYGSDQNLLIEGTNRTNRLLYSTNFGSANWDTSNGATFNGDKNSVISEKFAQSIGSGGSDFAQIRQNSTFNLTNEKENLYALVEKETADKCAVMIEDGSSGELGVQYDFTTNTAKEILVGSRPAKTGSVDFKVLSDASQPNGRDVVLISIVYYDATQGNSASINFLPDLTGSANSTILHHVQRTLGRETRRPIVSNGAYNSVSNSNVSIEKFSEYNDEEGTWLLSVEPKSFYSEGYNRIISLDNIDLWENPGEYPVEVRLNIPSTSLDPSDSNGNGLMRSFQENRIALSFDQSRASVSLNGFQSSITHSDDLGAHSGDIFLGTRSIASTYSQVAYIPRRISDRAAKAWSQT
ncbi:hypothetical protein GGP94_003156 [Salinibacter ruber]|uniref:hypothetical protein n=1 Tax=Salinibacter ruber TaxID=146919 RepID=UPI00216A7331|nr:hypothetical protein [Salinibacter ruber]MCS4162708.1 hypothetical protein [Salinibacter ruber]